MIVAASRNLKNRYFCPFCIIVIFNDLSQPAGNCFDDFNGCRTAYIALLIQLVCNICGQIGGSNNMAPSDTVLEAFCIAKYDCSRLQTGESIAMQNHD